MLTRGSRGEGGGVRWDGLGWAGYLEAMLHLLAKYLEMRPLFLCLALPMKEEWKMSPYLGVLPLVFRALKRAFSAPKICTVDAGYLAKFVKEPATKLDSWETQLLVLCVQCCQNVQECSRDTYSVQPISHSAPPSIKYGCTRIVQEQHNAQSGQWQWSSLSLCQAIASFLLAFCTI